MSKKDALGRCPFSWYRTDGLVWFRIFGKGFHIRDTARHPLLFSERNGHTAMWTIRRLR